MGRVDMSERILGPMFAPLQNKALFAQAAIEHGTVTWPNGSDLAPDVMYEEIAKAGYWIVRPANQQEDI
jgi:hypothetical protein